SVRMGAPHEKTSFTEASHSTNASDATASVAPRIVHRQRLRSIDLRTGLVADPGTHHRRVRDFVGSAAGNIHGRNVPGQSSVSTIHFSRAPSSTRVRRA